MKMGFAAMLVNTNHATLEDREDAFDGVCVDRPASIFLAVVIDRLVTVELFARGRRCIGPIAR